MPEEAARGNYDGLGPDDRAGHDESECGDAVDDPAENHLELVHGVNVGHAECGEHRQIQDADAAAEIASIHRHQQLEDRSAGHRCSRCVVRDSYRNPPGQAIPKGKQQRGTEHEPRQHAKESLRGRLNQEKCSRQAAQNARQHQRNHHAPGNVQLLGIGAAARGGSHPEGQSVGGVGGDRRNAGKQKSGKGDKTRAAGHSVDSATECAGEKEEDGVVQVRREVLTRIPFVLQRAHFPLIALRQNESLRQSAS